jgi:hypothetical protein
MNWAARRRLFILGTIGVVVLAILFVLFYHSFDKPPSCTDGIQDGGEQGIDCGGPCPYLCTALEQAPVVEFTQALPTPTGETDVIAYVENENQNAYALNVPYQVSLYTSGDTLGAAPITGTIDLPPGASVPVFIPNINSGKLVVTSAFLTLDPSVIKWQPGSASPTVPTVANTTLGSSNQSPEITATLDNPTPYPLSNVKVIIAIFNASGNVIAASQTVLLTIPAQGSAPAIFTWNTPFSSKPARIDVLPVMSPS